MAVSNAKRIEGRCLCGAVTLSAQTEGARLRACHCDMCRRLTSGMFISVETVPGTLTVTGPVRTFVSSDWAQRGFCGTCGSTLWYETRQDGMRSLAAGLFDNAAGGEMTLEFFSDRCPQGYRLAGDHRRLSTDETIAMFSGAGET
jgi:hypothetical protein